ncbi:MAG: hypothetical protein ACR2JB_04185 [Bryobacteraceae bacterium]
MITLSLDPHPGSHTVVAMDPNGASLGSITVPNTPEGFSNCISLPFRLLFVAGRSKERAIIS